ncbi:MAG: serine/threonine-protein kinase [Candidatus Ancaeobacter aquaticus]|nr:serine/threonine-protein kinase [Candidatus Ancaeobacter aquaticus]
MNQDNNSNDQDKTVYLDNINKDQKSLIGSRLGEFEITREINRGGMGVVYEAYQKNLKRSAAVKVLPKSFANQKTFVDRFHKEAEVLGSLSHPHIVPIYNFGAVNDIYYFAMEYIKGPTLSEVLTHKKTLTQVVDESEAINIIKQVALGINYAHHKGIIHRDIKPGNILMDESGRARIADFGLVKLQALGAGKDTTPLMGTPLYMSPEQAQGREIDYRSDIYSLGCVLYELLTNTPPFVDKTLKQLIRKIENDNPAPPVSLAPSTPLLLNNIVLKMIEKNPDHRYQSLDEFLTIIDRYEKGLLHIDLPRENEDTPKKTKKKSSKHSVPYIIIAGIIIVGISVYFFVVPAIKNIYYKEWAEMKLNIADNYRNNRLYKPALKIYEKIVRKVPTSTSGKAAQKKIEAIRKRMN